MLRISVGVGDLSQDLEGGFADLPAIPPRRGLPDRAAEEITHSLLLVFHREKADPLPDDRAELSPAEELEIDGFHDFLVEFVLPFLVFPAFAPFRGSAGKQLLDKGSALPEHDEEQQRSEQAHTDPGDDGRKLLCLRAWLQDLGFFVDLAGIVCDYDRVYNIVRRKRYLYKASESDGSPLGDLSSRIQKSLGRIAVLADSAHSLGASRAFEGVKKYCGQIADFTSFSFHAVKNFTTAEGGATTWLPFEEIDDAEIYHMFQLLSLHGQSKDAMAKSTPGAWEYDIIGPWYKCNMTDVLASIGLRQLDRYLSMCERRREIIDRYDEVCDELGLFHLNHHTAKMDSSNHLYLIRIPGADEEKRGEAIDMLAERGIYANVHYKPLPLMTAYGGDCSKYPNSYDYYRNLISLPLHTLLTDEDVAYICDVLREIAQ